MKPTKWTTSQNHYSMFVIVMTLFITSAFAGDDDLIFRDSFEPIDYGTISYVTAEDTVFDQSEAVLEVRPMGLWLMS